MHEEPSPLLAQVPLTVSPFINLPKPPTLPHNYTSLPSTLPPSILQTAPSASASASSATPSVSTTDSQPPTLPAYVTSPHHTFSAHPSQISAQNRSLLSRLGVTQDEARSKIAEWESGIEERELAEKRRRAPGWLDREEKILRPDRKVGEEEGEVEEGDVKGVGMGMETGMGMGGGEGAGGDMAEKGEELGSLMDRAFGGLK
ncbi:hypothetical protein CAC42_3478 [Sphaceloma murrayae]|uniref:Uncharacterized protein n=1 Tax=Sphaceloma murrayae TaxID=2082308 RepID=A0A2K1R1L3_9PEZI|nr:hypothetical protein CAC42_3478 [Sphaceloma murrayae]